jgi:hypothetical protein
VVSGSGRLYCLDVDHDASAAEEVRATLDLLALDRAALEAEMDVRRVERLKAELEGCVLSLFC